MTRVDPVALHAAQEAARGRDVRVKLTADGGVELVNGARRLSPFSR